MRAIVVTIIACVTAIACALLFREERASHAPRYVLYGMDETSSANGKIVKSVYRIDTITGKTWRVSSNPIPIGGQDPQHNPTVTWADGWEEMPESAEAAIAKAQAEWKRATSH